MLTKTNTDCGAWGINTLDFPVDNDTALTRTAGSMDKFLTGIQGRAFQMARMATGCQEEALDIVQDAMLKLVQKYSGKQAHEWAPLFYRILQSRIYDWHRRNTVKHRIFGWFGTGKGGSDDEDGCDPLQSVPDPGGREPVDLLQYRGAAEKLTELVAALPVRQQQAFLLRAWEGLSVADTARAMSVSEGSVKTHYFRAVGVLKKALEGHLP